MQRTLDRNPIAWLQQYSWKARMNKWGLCLAFMLIECAVGYSQPSDLDTAHKTLLLALAGIYTFAGVSGFLEDKRSGALELLLVTPISVNKLIFGRVWGLWKQFLPAGMVLAICFFYDENFFRNSREAAQAGLFWAILFLTLPVFATYFALRVKNLIVAAALTWVALWIPGFFVQVSFVAFVGEFDGLEMSSVLPALFFSYAAFALLACFLLRHSLSRRIFSF
jgi:ABC-type Na+ efflux pump permease subunit